MTLETDTKMEVMERLNELREQLKELENLGLHDSQSYDEVSEEYQDLVLSVLPGFPEESYCTLYVYDHDYDKETPLGVYDHFTTACEVGDEMLEADEILGYFVHLHDDDDNDNYSE